MTGKNRNAFCAVRPPGHHAGTRGLVTCGNDAHGSHGFCLLNNVVRAFPFFFVFFKKYFKDVSREFDEFRVNTLYLSLPFCRFLRRVSFARGFMCVCAYFSHCTPLPLPRSPTNPIPISILTHPTPNPPHPHNRHPRPPPPPPLAPPPLVIAAACSRIR